MHQWYGAYGSDEMDYNVYGIF